MSNEKQTIEETRDRLIELVKPFVSGSACEQESGVCEFIDCRTCNARALADHLLANGVIVLPCKVGDTLWIINSYANSRLEIINRRVEPIEIEAVAISKDGIEIETAEAIYFPEHFGELVFLTKEEAEKALEERSTE